MKKRITMSLTVTTEEKKEMIRLYTEEELTINQIARKVGRPEATTRKQLLNFLTPAKSMDERPLPTDFFSDKHCPITGWPLVKDKPGSAIGKTYKIIK